MLHGSALPINVSAPALPFPPPRSRGTSLHTPLRRRRRLLINLRSQHLAVDDLHQIVFFVFRLKAHARHVPRSLAL